jgi:hypothetical protein
MFILSRDGRGATEVTVNCLPGRWTVTKLEINYKIDRMRRGGPRQSDFMEPGCILEKNENPEKNDRPIPLPCEKLRYLFHERK